MQHCEVAHAGRSDDFDPARNRTPLQAEFAFWYTRNRSFAKTHKSYEQSMMQIGSFSTVESFWGMYSHMAHVGDLLKWRAYNLFRDGVRPMWEDEANRDGGKWAIRLRKGIASRLWENLVLAFVGGQFGECGKDPGEVCGIIMSIRQREDVLSIWNRHADDRDATGKVCDIIKRVLKLPSSTVMTYKRHDASFMHEGAVTSTTASSAAKTPAAAVEEGVVGAMAQASSVAGGELYC